MVFQEEEKREEEEENSRMDVDGDGNEDDGGLVMTLNTTDEFCRTLGDLPTYGLAGNRAEDDQTALQLHLPKVCCSSIPQV